MERDRGFSFKLLVPPRVNTGQVSAVRPRGITENCEEVINSVHKTYSKYFDQEKTMPLSTKSIPGQLYSKLFDEVEKIKCWKVKVDSDTVQKERKLQENKRTIETQRKAIQELQFGNESLSIKLEEQISENEDLINKNNAIQNLCNILKDTFERSAEKMHLFECEREETHHLFMENNESIQVNILISASFCEQQYEHLQRSNAENESLIQKLQNAEQQCKESEVSVSIYLLDLHRYPQCVWSKVYLYFTEKSGSLFNISNYLYKLFNADVFFLQINSLHEQTQNLKRLNEEDHQKLWKELESKSAFAAELENEVILDLFFVFSTEAIKNKEDSEIKCQYKITDMVTLMEKNKVQYQYDRMVEEKDAQLDEYKRKEMEAVAHGKSLELELLKHETENDCLKKQLSAEITEKVYRIRTPPSGDKSASLGKSTAVFDPSSDSSDQSDILVSNFYFRLISKCEPFCRLTSFQIQSPITHRSPGKSLKQAAMKRMRDAGWTAVTGCDKKKKTREKIFA
uniref:Synaptonemal complex protein 1 n=1 Tax=Sphaeramia orbicularis TaxID=375764 RepID=A0A672ZEG8_9TELE